MKENPKEYFAVNGGGKENPIARLQDEWFEKNKGNFLIEIKNEHGNKKLVNISGWIHEYISKVAASERRVEQERLLAVIDGLRKEYVSAKPADEIEKVDERAYLAALSDVEECIKKENI